MRAMPRLSSAEVFTPTSYPTHTYVQRDDLHHERLLRGVDAQLDADRIDLGAVEGRQDRAGAARRRRGQLDHGERCQRARARSAVGARARLVGRAALDDREQCREPRPRPRPHERAVQLGVTGTNTSHRGGNVDREPQLGDHAGRPRTGAACRRSCRSSRTHRTRCCSTTSTTSRPRSRAMSRSSSRMRRAAACGSASPACRIARTTSCARCPSCAAACSRSISTTGAAAT